MTKEKEINWYFTFCGNHKHPNGYIKIHGTFASSREKMFNRFDSKWGFQYPSKEKAGIIQFKLTEII